MNKYIDADKFYASQVARCCGQPLIGTCTSDNALLYDELQKMPTSDVVEVKHGQWKIDEYKNHLNVVCSNCNREFYVYKQGQYRIDRSNYCPNCGAKMNKGEDEE